MRLQIRLSAACGFFAFFSRSLTIVLSVLAVCACSTTPQGRLQLTTPAPVSDVYSSMDMQLQLAIADDVSTPCHDDECTANEHFDARVQRLGKQLAHVAYATYPDLSARIPQFEYTIAEKDEAGSASNARGKIVIYRGVQNLYLEDAALGFLIAREMGHVIGRHHDEKTATRVLFTVLVGVLLPVSNLLNGSVAAAQATSATSATLLSSTVASTATSYLGSRLMMAHIKPEQISESDLIALALQERLGWKIPEIDAALILPMSAIGDDGWSEDFKVSAAHVKALNIDPDTPLSTEDTAEIASQVAVTEDVSNEAEQSVTEVTANSATGSPAEMVGDPVATKVAMDHEPVPVAPATSATTPRRFMKIEPVVHGHAVAKGGQRKVAHSVRLAKADAERSSGKPVKGKLHLSKALSERTDIKLAKTSSKKSASKPSNVFKETRLKGAKNTPAAHTLVAKN